MLHVEQLSVRERPKPASHGRLKTSHFEERQFVSLTSWVHPAPTEVGDGESAQSGHDLTESYTIASPPCLTFTLDTLGGADAVTVTSWEGQYGKFNGGSGSDSLTILDGISVDGAQSGYEIQLFNIAGYGELS